MMHKLQAYINKVVQFSPLIANLFYLRQFLTSSKSRGGVKSASNHFDERRNVVLNSTVDFDELLQDDKELSQAMGSGGYMYGTATGQQRGGLGNPSFNTTVGDDYNGGEVAQLALKNHQTQGSHLTHEQMYFKKSPESRRA